MKIGIIGIGNMGKSIGEALLESNYELILSKRGSQIDFFRGKKVEILENKELVKKSDFIILAVKPNIYPKIAGEIKDLIENQIVVSIAAGMNIEKLEKMFGDKKIVMTMPNTPVAIKEGMSLVCPNKNISNQDKKDVLEIFSYFGKAIEISKEEFDAAAVINGCLPAYVDMFVEAISDAGVYCGLKRNLSYEIILQTIIGSAKLINNDHPAVLKDKVTSPKGTTIEGLRALEEGKFRATVMDGIIRAFEKNKKM